MSLSVARTKISERVNDCVEPILDVAGITRVSDITALDRIGVPVVAAITPMAKDLTTHLGKGATASAARVSAIMEAVERLSSEQSCAPKRRVSYDDLLSLSCCAVDPEEFDLPPSTTFSSDLKFTWVQGWDLVSCQPVWIPQDLVISPPCEGILDQVDTNGLASGSTYGEAIRHALLELIERDIVGRHQFCDLYGDEGTSLARPIRLNLESLPESTCALVDQLSDAGVDVVLEDLQSDSCIPVIAATIIDYSYPTRAGPTVLEFGGWGADPTPELAFNRAIGEACQSRLGYIQGARDSYNVIPNAVRNHTRLARRRRIEPGATDSAERIRGFSFECIGAEVEWIIDGLIEAGINQVIVIDVTRSDLRVPVVRVRIPSLSVFAVDRRRIGWRTARYVI